MRNPTLIACGLLPLLLVGCDEAKEKKQDEPVANQAAFQAEGHVDLEAVVRMVEEGEVESAAELEAKLNSEDDAIARVDVDGDQKPDRLQIVETRDEKATTFEIHAIPSSRVAGDAHVEADAKIEGKADAELSIETAPTVARLELVADADAEQVTAKASLSSSFSATAGGSLRASASADAKVEADAEATVTRTFGGISTDAEGRMVVKAEASAFLAWSFEVGRPTYVAKVFVVEEKPQAERVEKDPCWPPGHCKHGLWKSRGELPPGQEKHARADVDGRGEGNGKASMGGKLGGSAKGSGSSKSSGSAGSKGSSKSKDSSKSKSSSKSSSPKSKSSSKSKSASKGKEPSKSKSSSTSKSASKGKKGKN